MSSKRKKFSIQSHALLAQRIDGMLNALYSIPQKKLTDEQKAAIKSFEDQALEHRWKQFVTGDMFIMIT